MVVYTQRGSDIADWENIQSQVHYQQIGNLTNQITQLHADLQDWRRKHVKQKAKHKKWENKEKDSRQIILNLNQQILMLQNNLQNMTAIGDLTGITPLLRNVEFYDGQGLA
ncbi:650_t:CDS:2 [Entrophospora sp. SA101]|nr:650_t:CDS:2 [Entrophospora sp. SA101]